MALMSGQGLQAEEGLVWWRAAHQPGPGPHQAALTPALAEPWPLDVGLGGPKTGKRMPPGRAESGTEKPSNPGEALGTWGREA